VTSPFTKTDPDAITEGSRTVNPKNEAGVVS